ncbi:MAG: hypothetical protein V1723_00480 [Candidatus Uhrbacteria bacterium]
MTFSRSTQKQLARVVIATLSAVTIAICALVITGVLAGCESTPPLQPKLVELVANADNSPTINRGFPPPRAIERPESLGKIVDTYDLKAGRKAFIIEVNVPIQNKHFTVDTHNGVTLTVYQANFLRALHAQIATGVGMFDSPCTIESIAITNARIIGLGHWSFTFPSGAYVVVNCPMR